MLLAFLSTSVFANIVADSVTEIWIDAGSSGSRAHRYSLVEDDQASCQSTTIEGRCLEQLSALNVQAVTPGIADLALTQDVFDDYLDRLLMPVADPALIQPIDVYFLATAGMRQRSETDQKLRLAMVAGWFERHPTFQLKRLAVISGQEEGIYGWLSVNRLLDRLDDASTLVPVIDFGGASVEVTYPAQTADRLPPAEVVNLQVNNHIIALASHSYAGIGLSLAMSPMRTLPACYSAGSLMDDGASGQGDLAACVTAFQAFFNGVAPIQSVAAHTNNRTWYALGALPHYFADPRFLPILIPPLMFADMKQLVEHQACQKEQSVHHQANAHSSWNQGQFCAAGAYFVALLEDIGGALDPTLDIQWVSPAEGSVDWTLGAVLMAYSSHHYSAAVNNQ